MQARRKFVAAALCVVAASQTFAAEDQRPAGVAGDTWQFGPLNRWAYTHIREILTTKDIPNASQRVMPITGIDSVATDLTLTLDGKSVALSAAMQDLYVDGLLAIKDGTAVVERYGGTLTAERTHLLWSVSKTITGLTAAAVAADGQIDLAETVGHYVPELRNSGWGPDRLRDLLDMRDGSDWNEDYDAAESTVRRQDCADGLLSGPLCLDTDVIGNYRFLPTVGRDPSRAGQFVYKSGSTDVVAWALEEATGKRFADLVSEYIWRPMGAERSAGITVDVAGFTLASGGMFATLRDLGRVGLMMLNLGRVGEQQVVPREWLQDVFSRDGARAWPEEAAPGLRPYYRSFVWGHGDGRGTVTARGVHGQYIYVAPESQTVIALFSSWPNADGGEPGVGPDEALALLTAVEQALN